MPNAKLVKDVSVQQRKINDYHRTVPQIFEHVSVNDAAAFCLVGTNRLHTHVSDGALDDHTIYLVEIVSRSCAIISRFHSKWHHNKTLIHLSHSTPPKANLANNTTRIIDHSCA